MHYHFNSSFFSNYNNRAKYRRSIRNPHKRGGLLRLLSSLIRSTSPQDVDAPVAAGDAQQRAARRRHHRAAEPVVLERRLGRRRHERLERRLPRGLARGGAHEDAAARRLGAVAAPERDARRLERQRRHHRAEHGGAQRAADCQRRRPAQEHAGRAGRGAERGGGGDDGVERLREQALRQPLDALLGHQPAQAPRHLRRHRLAARGGPARAEVPGARPIRDPAVDRPRDAGGERRGEDRAERRAGHRAPRQRRHPLNAAQAGCCGRRADRWTHGRAGVREGDEQAARRGAAGSAER
eukprot:scaffold81455_cov69-Phaeocystis_antarctica.AAC.1